MGPRSADRGNVGAVYLLFFLAKASMGPRSADSVNLSGFGTKAIQRMLQWGREQLIAEIAHSQVLVLDSPRLQWGRDQLIAEIILEAWLKGWDHALQWGRDQLIAEIKDRATEKPAGD